MPANAAIAEYTPTLLQLVGQVEVDDTFPPVWSLALPGARPFSPEASLGDSGVVDGATLYLRDCAAGEFDEPVVTDLEETVEQAGNGGARWGRSLRAYTCLVLCVLSLTVGFATLIGTHPAQPAVGVAAIVVAFGLALLGWHATRQGWSLPLGVRLLLAHSAIPLLALAAVSLQGARRDSGALPMALSIGAMLGGVAAVLAVRHATTLTALSITALAVPVTVGLVAGHASLLESAAVAAVVLWGVMSIAPKAAGHVAVMAGMQGAQTSTDEAEVVWLVGRSRRLLIGINMLCSVLLGACLVVLGTADQVFALSLAVCMGLALVLRAGQLTVVPAVVPVVCAGTAGLVTVLLHGPAYFGAPGWVGPVVLLLATVAALGIGLNLAFRPDADDEERPSWLDPLAAFLALVCVLLAVGVFGVYAAMLHMGQSM
ncbi:EsaB/YukD family protein (plasmid) [Streptomyces sp. FXJ1.172]|uniref:EsaB/YukD family protein n=1 Tax=Streptomyces sp. FXJ1.172 TaxID=710705 RepID=UPI0023DD4272|nr:EsaB/YukD family protein [Streptomyces sp. FXJ1.172]WEP00619.1 EsaB/YukD family protein [Streptomyces sp. FXJ1.172]